MKYPDRQETSPGREALSPFDRGITDGALAVRPALVPENSSYPKGFRLNDFEDEIKFLKPLEKPFRTPYTERFDLYADALAYMNGYIQGLDGFVQQHRTESLWSALYPPVILNDASTVQHFITGLERGQPPVLTEAVRPYSEKKYNVGFEDSKKYWDVRKYVPSGYKLGFAVSISRDFGLPVDFPGVPADYASYAAFLGGQKGDERPETTAPLFDDFDKPSQRRFEAQQEETTRENSYLLGLNVWLRQQGIESVNAAQIRHPMALKAFKSVLEGSKLGTDILRFIGWPTYDEPLQQKIAFEEGFPKRRVIESGYINTYFEKKYKKYNEEILTGREQREARSGFELQQFLAREQVIEAIRLGGEIREQRISKMYPQQPSQESPANP